MIAIIDYNAGNTCSVINALERLGIAYELTADHDKIRASDKIILPGVGHAKAAMDNLESRGLVPVLRRATQPFLGICVGMQLMAKLSTEGPTDALDIVDATVQRFDFQDNTIKVPHMGWNKILINKEHYIFEGIADESYAYFVHSYYMPMHDTTISSTRYGIEYSAAIQKDNFVGVQFHPEKSGTVGEQILRNFVENY